MLAKKRIWDKSAPLSEFPARNDFMRAVLFMIQASASNTRKTHSRLRRVQGKRHHEKSVGLGNSGCWSRGGLHDVSSWRVTGCDCSAYGDQPFRVVGDGIENSFQLRQFRNLLWTDKNREVWFSLEENHEKAYHFGLHQLRNCRARLLQGCGFFIPEEN